jgi:hypothetical protein
MSRLVFSNCCIKSTKKISKIAILSLFYSGINTKIQASSGFDRNFVLSFVKARRKAWWLI